MARKVRDASLDSKTARLKLSPRRKPYYRVLGKGLHLGYRRPATKERAGAWVMRYYVGGAKGYDVKNLAAADDFRDANGFDVLSFHQAIDLAQSKFKEASSSTSAPPLPFTVDAALDRYFDRLEAEHSKSLADARNRAKNHIRPALGAKLASDLTREDLTKWRNAVAAKPRHVRGKKGKSARPLVAADTAEEVRRRRATANRCFTVLKAALNQAFRDGKVASDAAWRAVKPFREADAARVHYFTVAEAQRIVNAAQGPFRTLVNAALLTGCRYGELGRLRVGDFNAHAGTLFVEKSKSGKARHVVLTDEGRQFFAGITAGREAGDVLLAKDDGSAWASSHQLRPMREACEAARLKPTGFHVLRHTYASLLAMAGAPLNVIARNLGHADTRMCERHYAHLSPSYVAETIRRFAPTFGTVNAGAVVSIDRART